MSIWHLFYELHFFSYLFFLPDAHIIMTHCNILFVVFVMPFSYEYKW